MFSGYEDKNAFDGINEESEELMSKLVNDLEIG